MKSSRPVCKYCFIRTVLNHFLLFDDRKEGEDPSAFEPVLCSASPLSDEEREEIRFLVFDDYRARTASFVQDRYYIPRLIASAAVFLFCYFFFSLAVRDSVVMIDEILISCAAAAACFVLMRRNELKKAWVCSLLDEGRKKVSALEEEVSADIAGLEAFLDQLSGLFSVSELADVLAGCSTRSLPAFDADLPAWLTAAFSAFLKKEGRAYKKWIRNIRKREKADTRLSALLKAACLSDGLDIYLLALLSQLGI